ncbi:dihydroneopterin aldolase [uncultured Prochlorococcus sp.]|uniref:dihydroneopterin aldolase n=1 Tax=uncultured Prochlorococcus sp. TaxID=159733 RepID=UPI002583AEF3|nr:dihydroneopterin aldolase [uncultured Prochlorococcus sp.]
METFLKIEKIKLWARVGVLDEERQTGQLFNLDVFLWTDFEKCTSNDDIKKTVDYSKLVEILKDQSREIYCLTIEKYSNAILEIIDKKFKLSKIKIILTKCHPPIAGFDGKVSIIRILENK